MADGPQGGAKNGEKVEAVFMIILAIGMIGLLLTIISIDIRNTEAIFGAPPVTSLGLNLAVFLQLPQLFLGQVPGQMALPIIMGWTIFFFMAAFIFNYTKSVARTKRFNVHLGGLLFWGCILAFIIAFFTNINSGLAPDGLVLHILFALIIAAGELFLPGIGIAFAEHGIGSW